MYKIDTFDECLNIKKPTLDSSNLNIQQPKNQESSPKVASFKSRLHGCLLNSSKKIPSTNLKKTPV